MKMMEQKEREDGELSSTDDDDETGDDPKKRKKEEDCLIVHVDKAIDEKLRAKRRVRQIVELVRLRIRFYGRNARITDYFPKL